MATHLSLQKKTTLANGSHPIVLSIGFGTNLQIATGLSCLDSEWDARTQLYTGKGAASVNRALSAMLANASSVVLELAGSGKLAGMSRAQLRAAITGKEVKRKVENSIAEVFEKVMALKAESTRFTFASALRKIGQFCDASATPIGDITRTWLAQFEACPAMREVKASSRKLYLHKLRHVINFALDEEMITKDPFRRFKMPKALYRRRALPVEKVRAIISAPMGKNIEQYRDLWVLTFCLIGINCADLYRLKPKGGRAAYIRAKTGRPYNIKVEPEAAAIFEKWADKDGVLAPLKGALGTSQAMIGYYLPKVKEAVNAAAGEELISELTLYWARHSWATIAASLDIPKDVIAMALGHGRLSVTDGYIDYEQAGFAAKVDAANRKVLDFVFYGKNQ